MLNWFALLQGAKTVAAHPITKGGSLAALVTGGLYAASFAGIAIPELAFTVGPLAGYVLYRFLPVNTQKEIDDATQAVIDGLGKLPEIDPTYPTAKGITDMPTSIQAWKDRQPPGIQK